jgi:DHA1 family bicyclomycin/chloramphenicol resistance-like MFS transporter
MTISYPVLAVLLAFLSAIGPFSIDAYLPAFPAMEAGLNTTAVAMQQSLSAYMLPFSIMMLWHGSISDALGRRRVIIAGLIVYALSSLLCALAPNIHILILGRVLQGMSAGVGVIVGRAVVRDVLDGPAAQRLMSHIAMVFSVAPALAPILGGNLTAWFGWRAIFIFLIILSLTQLYMAIRFLPESLPPEKRQPLHPAHLLKGYASVMLDPGFILLSLASSFFFAGFFIYVMSAPVFLIQHLKLGPTQFGWLFVPLVAGMFAGSYAAVRLSHRLSIPRTILLAFAISAISVIANLIANLYLPSSVATRIPQLAIHTFAQNIAFPALTLLALDMFPERRGMAASCQGFIQTMIMGIAAGAIVPLLWDSTLHLAYGTAICWILAITTYLLYARIVRRRAAALI